MAEKGKVNNVGSGELNLLSLAFKYRAVGVLLPNELNKSEPAEFVPYIDYIAENPSMLRQID